LTEAAIHHIHHNQDVGEFIRGLGMDGTIPTGGYDAFELAPEVRHGRVNINSPIVNDDPRPNGVDP